MSVILSLMLFLLGNILIPTTHYLIEHHHEHESPNADLEHDCSECLIIESSNDFEIKLDGFICADSYSADFLSRKSSIVQFNVFRLFSSRAPPIIS